MIRPSALCLPALLIVPVPAQTSPRAPAGDEARQLAEDLKKFEAAARRGERKYRFGRIVALGPAAAARMQKVVGPRLAKLRADYCSALAGRLRDAYLARLESLTDAQVLDVQKTRRLWRGYVLHGGHRANFQAVFLDPIERIARFLLLRPEDVADEALRDVRKELDEFAAYAAACGAALGTDPDPTAGKVSPTGIPYPKLDQPPTFLDDLRHTERTLVLIHTVAPPGARPVLEFNDRAAREIDVQEAEFVLYSNVARMLAGTIAWQVDPLGCAVARDHSNDRKLGVSKGHMSSIPEKRGFTHRSVRMGAARFGSEGVGGGGDGRGYIRGLSYGGGHTGPLYSLKRNCVGVGRRGNAYTSIYRTIGGLVHPCQATEGRLALPPGVTDAEVRGPARAAFKNLYSGRFGAAFRQLEKSRTDDPREAMFVRFARAAVEAEADWLLGSAAAIEAAGDVFEAHRRLQEGAKSLAGVPRFETGAAPMLARLEAEAQAAALRAGREFHRLAHGPPKPEALARARAVYGKRFAGTVYADALKAWDDEAGPFGFFVARRPDLEQYDYPASWDAR